MRVLMIDDSEPERNTLADRLGECWPFEGDLEVRFADDGVSAVDVMKREPCDVILVDWHLQFLGGREVLRALRGNGVNVPVIAVSGLCREEIPIELEHWGVGFLGKDEMNATHVRDAVVRALEFQMPVPTAA